ncbi:MAG: HupE/UreJ family protein [Microcoleaceae cyanobacterium]
MNYSSSFVKALKAGIPLRQLGLSACLTLTLLLLQTLPALAHHPFGGETPDSAFGGFLSGLGHPVIGLDHLAFVIAAGLLASTLGCGLILPVVFVLASLAGTGLHLMGLELPAAEFLISASVLLFGVLLALKHKPSNILVVSLGAIAGLLHGYAYGEAIFGAEMGPLVAYLLGFASIQLAIAYAAYWIGQSLGSAHKFGSLNLRFAGFALAGIGFAFLSTLIVDTVFPA